jgi:valyl-tRNA synthetase
MDAIVAVRRAKTLVDMGNQKIAEAYIKTDLEAKDLMGPFIARLAKVEDLKFTDSKVENSVSDISEYVEVYIPTGSIDLAPIVARLSKQSEKLEKEISKLNGMLSNERFVANAPDEVIVQNKEALADAQVKQQKIIEQLDSLQG